MPALAVAQDTAAKPRPWTLDEAKRELALSPRDPYLQYVALQLARRAGQEEFDKVAQEISRAERPAWQDRRESVDLFSLFTGALAVQESLQLDAMRAGRSPDRTRPATPNDVLDPKRAVEVAALSGPEIKSHPWAKMLGDKKPDISPLARCVPEDFYFVQFRSLNKLIDLADLADSWGTHLLNQASHEARSQTVSQRLRTQLAVSTNPVLRPVYDGIIDEVAITGSDLFLREGSDVTLVFRIRQPVLFRTRMDGFIADAEKAGTDLKRTTGKHLDVDYTSLVSPDRSVSVYSAYPTPALHVRSNSLTALKRVLEAIAGKTEDGTPVARLGDSLEFAYIRTLLPQGAAEEDGLVYLSDPFIRRLMGPTVKLTEARRVRCYNHLRMIANASLMFRSEFARTPASLAELAEKQCAPGTFGAGELACPNGGAYSLSADGATGMCSHHGNAVFMTPCLEAPVKTVSRDEADAYKQFLDEYKQYWRTYFDPIVLRAAVSPRQARLETVILPLIDNSIYTALSGVLGGKPEQLEPAVLPKRNICTVAMRMNKETLGDAAGKAIAGMILALGGVPREQANKLNVDVLAKGLGNQVAFHICDASPMLDFNMPRFLGETLGELAGGSGRRDMAFIAPLLAPLLAWLTAPVYVSIPVEDAKVVDTFLEQLDDLLAVAARKPPQRSFLWNTEYDFFRTTRENAPAVRGASVSFGPLKLRVFWARIGNTLYVASKQSILDDLSRAIRPQTDRKPETSVGHAMVRVRPENWAAVVPDYKLAWAESNRRACLNNLAPIANVARCEPHEETMDLEKAAEAMEPILKKVDAFHGQHLFCPEGGTYLFEKGRAACSVHGHPLAPKQGAAPEPKSESGKFIDSFNGLTATLTFLEDGLHAVVVLERK